ncbi:tRNA guanosine(34) transglycosylase Tgt [Candidatus Saccharibacteria bacterium]|nr:tRNA guanosine(34) transglycosylase Tgt [Candidatus Saccharibacteria bacterium]
MLKFEILQQKGLMRTGVISTPHGRIRTPAFVGAATRAAMKALTVKQMSGLGLQAVLANAYHLVLAPGSWLVKEAGGLAKFMGWEGPTFTDSGGFQIMSLPGVRVSENGAEFKSHINGDKLIVTPESSMRAQWEIGADIHMAFDCPVGYGVSRVGFSETKDVMKRTHVWAERCLLEHQKLANGADDYQSLYGVVQGGDFADLRRESAEFFAALEFDGYGIGGMYSVDEGRKLLGVMNEILPNDRPRHWLGMGQEPADLFVGVEFGCDTFDCVGPTRIARNGTLYSPRGRMNIRNAKYRTDFGVVDAECDCELCKNYSVAYLHHLFKVDEITGKILASIHNERFVVRTMDRIREAILEDKFESFRDDFLQRYYC